ncbi:H repeat-associated protein ybfD [Escherichia coli BIDMC 39]|nr:H repeat-associated protein ybfD [Escherichia coli BIDMC 39]
MELKKLMEHISIIPDYRQAWKVEHKLSDILLLTICAVISGAEGWEDIEDFGETHPDFLKQYGDFENGIPVHDTIARVVSCICPVSVLRNFMRALLTGCLTTILQMIKTSSQLMEKYTGILMTRVAVRERFMSLVRSQQCTVWSSDRSRRIRNPMRSQLSLNFLTCWILKEKSSKPMRWVARKILQRRYKNREVIIYSL